MIRLRPVLGEISRIITVDSLSEFLLGLPIKGLSHSSCLFRLILRIVADGICFSSVKEQMCSWEPDIQKWRKQAAAVLLGHLYTQAAVKKAPEDRGQGFKVCWDDVLKELQMEYSYGGLRPSHNCRPQVLSCQKS